jgi:uncharacterized protein YcbX
MGELAGLRVYPVKSLPGVDVERATVAPGGTLARDRRWALFEGDAPLTAKREPRVHDLDVDYDLSAPSLTVRGDGDAATFHLDDERAAAADWFSAFFDRDLELRGDDETGFPDRPSLGPSVVARSTLATVAGWFDGVDPEGLGRRLRVNLVVDGVEPFWTERFAPAVAPSDAADAFRVGDVRIEGGTRCGRCPVPARDPATGDAVERFRERFVARRRATYPDWLDPGDVENHYSLMLVGRVPAADRGAAVAVGDAVVEA